MRSTLRRWFIRFAGAILLLGAVLVARTLVFSSRQVRPDSPVSLVFDSAAAADRLAGALRFRTVSNQDPARFAADEFLGLHQHLERSFPRIHMQLEREVVGGYSLLYTWKGSDPRLRPVLLLSHLDVVPVEPGTEALWTHPPFEGRIADGFVWGRGAWDDKIGVLSILEAIETLLAEGFLPARTVLLAFGHDEEVGGTLGAAKMASILEARGVQPEFVLDEGLVIGQGLVPGISVPVALIGMAEKGSVSVELSVRAEGGHSSMPPRETAIGILCAAVRRLEDNPMAGGLVGLPLRTFSFLGPEMPWPHKLVAANLWLFAPLVERQLSARPASDALLRTTTAATIIEGGVKQNVLPSHARAIVNFRIRPGENDGLVLDHVRKVVADPRVEIAKVEGSGSEPSQESSVEAAPFTLLQRTVRQVLPEAVVAPSLVVGGTDARHYERLCSNVYRFLPVRVGPGDLARFHGTDERVALEDSALCVRFYYQLLRNAGVSG